MYGLNGFAFVAFGIFNILSVQLCRCVPSIRKRVLRMLCIILLLGNVLRYSLSPLFRTGLKVPVEFSTVAYFAVPFILLADWKRARSWAAYSGLMAGFFYYITIIAAGGPIYNNYPAYDIYISMFCHGTLYLCGMVTIGTETYSRTDGRKLVLGIGYVVARAIVLRPFAEGEGRLFIYELLDAAYVKQMLPPNSWGVAVPFYYIIMGGLLLLSVRLFFKSNQRCCQKYDALRRQR